MSSMTIALIVFACVFSSAMFGMYLRTILPEHHLNSESKDAVKLATGLVATISALVLSLLISSAKGSFDRLNSELVDYAAKVVTLDRILAEYGTETRGLRESIKREYKIKVDLLTSSERTRLRRSIKAGRT